MQEQHHQENVASKGSGSQPQNSSSVQEGTDYEDPDLTGQQMSSIESQRDSNSTKITPTASALTSAKNPIETPKDSKEKFDPRVFKAPHPNQRVMAITGIVNRSLIFFGVPFVRKIPLIWNLPVLRDVPGLGSTAKVNEFDFPESEVKKIKQYANSETCTFFGPNHPEFWTDWALDKIFSEQVLPTMSHWAFYKTVNANKIMQKFWLANNLIATAPIGKKAAMDHAVNWAKSGRGNLLHPAGAVGWTGSRIQDLRPGIIDMSIRASLELIEEGSSRPVYAIPGPISHYYFIEDVSWALKREMRSIEKKLRLPNGGSLDTADRFAALQVHILKQRLEKFDSPHAKREITPANFFQVQEEAQEELLSRLAEKYGEREGSFGLKLHLYEVAVKEARSKEDLKIVNEVRRLNRFKSEVYQTEALTQEQIAETLKCLKYDLVNFTFMDKLRNMMPVAVGWRNCTVRAGEVLDVRSRLEERFPNPNTISDAEKKEFSAALLTQFRDRMQSTLDELVASAKPTTSQWAKRNPFCG